MSKDTHRAAPPQGKKSAKQYPKIFLSVCAVIILLYGAAYLHFGAPSPADWIAKPETASENIISQGSFNYAEIPEYSDSAYVVVNGNEPYFTKNELTDKSYEYYPQLDSLGRCGICSASIGEDLMPTEKRESISSVKPTGWHSVSYDFVDGKSLYNRCHLIGFQLAGENANEKNLITGTRYLNVTGMLPFENMVADYVKETGNHVMYRVTPVFIDDELVARGVLMEGYSVEDDGDGVKFCVFCYNVQPGVVIDYQTGESCEEGSYNTTDDTTSAIENGDESVYILNMGTKKFHLTSCSSAKDISAANKSTFTGTRDQLIEKGYVPCKACDP